MPATLSAFPINTDAASTPMPELFDHCVAIFALPDDPADLRDVLQAKLGLNRIDAGIDVHQVPGVLKQRFTRGQALHVAESVAALGIRSAVFAESVLPDLEHAETVHHLRCAETGLEIFNLEGEADRRWRWSELRTVSIGRVPLEQTRAYPSDVMVRPGPTPAPLPVDTGRREGYEAWLIFADPRRVLHIDSEHMNYESLEADLATSGTVNFEVLAGTIVSRARWAFLTPAARAYLNHGPVIDYDFESSEALRHYTLTQHLLSLDIRGG